ncbi:MAG: Trk system potassium transporter TrkA [Alphaproteobacteria bacterium]|nr:MAG: Trk system potassium transporter TrkA [Alphaproteobacteria bacterium]
MKVIICGAGQVGWQIARHLAREDNDVTVVDVDAELVGRATEILDVRGVVGFASHPDVLERAGAADVDMVIAATHSDEVNMVVCQVAHSVFEVPTKIARLRAQAYLEAIRADLYRREHMPIDVVISPEREVAQATLRRLDTPSAFESELFLDGRARLLGLRLDERCPVLSTPLRQLSELFSTLTATVVGVRRRGRLFAPEPGDQLFAGDEIYILTRDQETARTLEIFGRVSPPAERVVIIGGGNVGLAVARGLESRPARPRVKVIERDREVAERAAETLARTVVLHGDGLDAEILLEAGIERADAVIALTDDDKTNLLAATRSRAMRELAAEPGSEVARLLTISLVNDPELGTLAGPLGIDALINPRAITVSSILRHLRHGRVRAIYSVGDAEAELIEAEVLPHSPLTRAPLRDLDLPEGALVGLVWKAREGVLLRPSAETRFEPGDLVLIFVLAADVPAVDRLLQVNVEYFGG